MIRIATACLALYWIALCVATHLPSSRMPSLQWSDKTYHVIAFAGLAFLLGWAIQTSSRLRHAAWVGGIAVTYAITDELTQKFIPGRSCELADAVADCVGVVIGLGLYTIIRQTLVRFAAGRNLIKTFSR